MTEKLRITMTVTRDEIMIAQIARLERAADSMYTALAPYAARMRQMRLEVGQEIARNHNDLFPHHQAAAPRIAPRGRKGEQLTAVETVVEMLEEGRTSRNYFGWVMSALARLPEALAEIAVVLPRNLAGSSGDDPAVERREYIEYNRVRDEMRAVATEAARELFDGESSYIYPVKNSRYMFVPWDMWRLTSPLPRS